MVEIEVRLPGHLDELVRARLLEDELARGNELAQAGLLRAIWRVPGRRANRAIGTAADATELHVTPVSLPCMDVAVTPLATHPLAESCRSLAPSRG